MTLDPLSRLRLCRKYTFEFRGTLDIELSTIWALHDFTDQLGAPPRSSRPLFLQGLT